MQRTEATAIAADSDDDALRIACAEVRPWSYRARHAPPEREIAAIAYVAARLGRRCVYGNVPPADLVDALLRGAFDIAIGDLPPEPCASLRAVRLPHARVRAPRSASDRRFETRHALFPEVWWMRADDVRLRWRVRLALLRWRFAMPADDGAILAASRSP
ncbi:MAG: hypothetical protein ACTHOH_18200 [Lysobacteraceae bacterium]